MTPSTVLGKLPFLTRFKITLPTAICPDIDSAPLSAQMIRDSQYNSPAS